MRALVIVVVLTLTLSAEATVFDIVMKKEKDTWQRLPGTVTIDNTNNTVTISDNTTTYTLKITSVARIQETLDSNNTRIETRESDAILYILGEEIRCTFISVWSEFSTVSLIIIYLDDYEMELVRYKVQ